MVDLYNNVIIYLFPQALGRLLKILTKEDKALKNQKSKNSWYANEDHKRVQIISSLKVCTGIIFIIYHFFTFHTLFFTHTSCLL